ncbi:MFS general substrate transporter [Aspergillus steynii IBT 23096]|uniref:MFS general substrate transporter n=1 Tax=Aspergillus steynii IBT 23096 TaxID=1392250 RepID=A0A2I2GKR2_9EURO|nr:MFS general substrate transporter [Aspergillus steynii IBT 23096]PLB53473.1 MFS general substrate transporter [Aspergillus steynii IBT 23096]
MDAKHAQNDAEEVLEPSELDSPPLPPSKIPFFRSTLFQALVIAGVFFCGPGMYGALNALGAGGLKSPLLVNITSGLSYGLNVIFALLTGVFVNVLGERIVLSLGVIGFSINGASLYCNNMFGNTWLMYFSSALQGFTTALLWVVQAAIMLAYPEPDFKGRFIAIWYTSIALGQSVGGALALGFNVSNKEAGAVTPVTYIPLIAIAACGPFIALLISRPHQVIRRDGVEVLSRKQPNAWQEAKRMLLLLPLFIYSQWFLSYNSTFTAVYHSVRGRALTSFTSAFAGVAGTFAAGVFLDKKNLSRSTKFRWSYFAIYILYTLTWVWDTVVQWYYSKTNPVGLDWAQSEFYASFLLILVKGFVDHAFQTWMYALIGTLTEDVDELARYTGFMKAVNTGGAALGYAVQTKWSMMGSEALLLGLWVVQIIPTWLMVRRVKD